MRQQQCRKCGRYIENDNVRIGDNTKIKVQAR